jgi:exodeoxyribonuclease VII large subunit
MSQFEFLPPSRSDRPYTVAEINEGIATLLESANSLVWIEGEISNWKPTSSGHCYFRMKDQDSQIPAVMWKTTASQLNFKPQDGTAVMAVASIRVYQKGGYYQLDVHRMQPLGSGALHLAFEKLKQKLEKEGLFDISFKKPLPVSVTTLGVITSKQGAAIHDIVRVISSRAPQTDIVLIDVPVQGIKAAPEIANAITRMNEYGKVDCLIVGRGGGSIEDLWAFNEEIVARAIFDSQIPVISAIGHEIDFTIADFVADVRAPTPSAAAEIAVADSRENRHYFDSCAQRFSGASQRYFDNANQQYLRIIRDKAFRVPVRMLKNSSQELDENEARCKKNLERLLERAVSKFVHAGAKLDALSPLSVLSRGFAVVTGNDGLTIRDSKQLSIGDPVQISFCKGNAVAEIISIDNNSSSAAS